jgi:hypothetical protein
MPMTIHPHNTHLQEGKVVDTDGLDDKVVGRDEDGKEADMVVGRDGLDDKVVGREEDTCHLGSLGRHRDSTDEEHKRMAHHS